MKIKAGIRLKLEEIEAGTVLAGVVPGKLVSVVAAEMQGQDSLELTYKVGGSVAQRMLSRADEEGLLAPSAQASPRSVTRWQVATLALLAALMVGAYLFWNRSGPRQNEALPNDTPVVIRTNGGLLEVATVKYNRSFNLKQVHTILGVAVPFCKESASYTVDTYITYRVRLAKRWDANFFSQRLYVTAPKLEPSLPVAFDTSTLRPALQKCAVMPSLDTQNDLLRRITTTLETDAKSARYIDIARDQGARETVREFVQKWLINQKGYNIPANAPIDVKFADE